MLSMTEQLEYALALAQRGWPVFPCDPRTDPEFHKHPLNTKGHHGATLRPKAIEMQWRTTPDALVGVALPRGTVALDVDDVELYEAAGLDLPDGPGQRTYSGGFHRFFKTDGRVVRQTVKEIPGADTRVGGKGYVVAWEPDAFPTPDDLPDAPEWLYDPDAADESTDAEIPAPHRGRSPEVITVRMGERDNKLTSIAGTMRRAGLGPDAIYAALKAMVDSGQVEQTREDPIRERDLKRIAGSIGGRGSDAVEAARRKPPERHFANDILTADHGELKYFIDELIPEGVGIIGGAPKIGKSWLVLQAAMEISDGTGTLLDRPVLGEQPVLYYALEDGLRRAKSRMLALQGFHQINVDMLEWRFDAPLLGEGLEDDVQRWVTDNKGGVVIVDVLAMVQPESKSRGSAYNADYTMLKEIRNRVKSLRDHEKISAAVAFVTHVRKMGAEDPFATLQGTTGVTGSVDWAWVIKRGRMDPKGTIQINGRDIEKEPYIEAIFNGAWTAVGNTHRGGSKQRNNILDTLLTEGDLTTAKIRRYVNETVLGPEDTPLTNNGVNEKLNAMKSAGLVEQTDRYERGADGGYVWHALTQDEIDSVGKSNRAVASAAEDGSGHGRGIRVRRTTMRERASTRAGAPARERPRPHAPQAPHVVSEPIEPVEGVEGVLRAPRRPRAPAHTHVRTRVAPTRQIGVDYDADTEDDLTPI